MNRYQKEKERRRVLNKIRYSNRYGSHINSFKAYNSESEDHMDLKYLAWKKLRKNEYDTWCEVIFTGGQRADIIAFKDGLWLGYEIAVSEKLNDYQKKIKKYPQEITWNIIKSKKDIEKIE